MKRIMIIVVSVLLLTGCSSIFNKDGCSPGFHEQNGICVEDFDFEGNFESSDDILSMYLTYTKKQELLNQRFGWGMVTDLEFSSVDTLDSNSYEKGSDDFSSTNNQVEGVDEMDNVLTDGKYIYISNYDRVQIVLAYTETEEYNVLDIVKEIAFENLTPENGNFYFNGMYVDEERFIIVGTEYTYTCIENGTTEEPKDGDLVSYCRYNEYHSRTHVWEYSKEEFEIINEYKLSGAFVGSRKINDDLYFVTNEYIPYYYMNNDEIDFNLDNYIPNYSVNNVDVRIGYTEVLYIEGTEPTNFTTFYGINLGTEEVSTEVVLGGGGYNLYVSHNNIYLTGTKWIYNEDFILELEKAENVDDVEVEGNPYEVETSIIRVAIIDGVVDFGAEGSVPGITLDQFSMSEQDGYVRMVTTSNRWWWWGEPTTVNNKLLILNQNLDVISTLDGIGKPGETVQSTRFVGDYAYVVTFLRTDPFYVIDLSDPRNPIKLSELEIPGFSDYLQPIGEDYMLGIGYGDFDGGTQGLKISLYDISDKSNAVVASEVVYPYSTEGYMWTSTVYNHKDLLVSIEKGIIALPYTRYKSNTPLSEYSWTYHTGVLVLNLDAENGTISERGRVEHSEAGYHDIYVYKSKFISNYLYTISSKYIKVSTINNPETILDSLLVGESRQYYYGSEVIVD